MTENRTRLWMDCDTGFDDLVAMVLLKDREQFDWVGISTVVGNTTLENTTANTLAAVEAFGIDVPVHMGAAKPLAQDPQTIEALLGGGAMGTVGDSFPAAQHRVVEPVDAVQGLITALEAGPLTILGTGPVTNIAMALMMRPDLSSNVERVVFMGGSTTTGNHTASAEFNTYADPESLDVLVRSGVPLEMFGLNLTRQVMLQLASEEEVRSGPGPHAKALGDHVGYYLRMLDKKTAKPMALHDPSAAAYLVWPDLFELQDGNLQVELRGTHTRGRTVVEFRVPGKAEANARIAVKADGEEVLSRTLAVLRAS